jgi:hypothetical protein
LLAAIGTLLGAVLARVISASLVSFLSTGRDPLSVPIALDWRVLGFTTATAVATTILFGLAPALRATSAPLESVMRASSRGLTTSRGRSGWQRVLVVAQVALSLVMVLVALLFMLSLRNLTGVDTGFSVDSLVATDSDSLCPPLSHVRPALSRLGHTSGASTPWVLNNACRPPD